MAIIGTRVWEQMEFEDVGGPSPDLKRTRSSLWPNNETGQGQEFTITAGICAARRNSGASGRNAEALRVFSSAFLHT
jgi:hypothetical protein